MAKYASIIFVSAFVVVLANQGTVSIQLRYQKNNIVSVQSELHNNSEKNTALGDRLNLM